MFRGNVRSFEMGKIAMAGPLANITLVIISMAVIRICLAFNIFQPPEHINFQQIVTAPMGLAHSFALLMSIVLTLNLVLAMFNLLPFPPLDGHSLPYLWLSRMAAEKYERFFTRPNASMIGLIIAWNLFDYIFSPIHLFVINTLYAGITNYG